MTAENIVFTVSFVAGVLVGIAIFGWIIFSPPASRRDDDRFETFPDTCIVSDLGTSFQVYCAQ